MHQLEAAAFVRCWVEAWNRHDLEGVLEHFHDDATFSSPVARDIGADVDGVLFGKSAIRRYWRRALENIPDLRFEVERYFVGVDALVIQYRNQRGTVVDEVLLFDGALVRSGFGTYPSDASNPAGLAGHAAE